jgi:hypothetical protein
MKIKSDHTINSNQKVSATMQHFMLSLLKVALVHPENLDSGKKQLKAYCENEQLSYRAVERNLDLFVGLLADYRKENSPVLYHFLRLQAQFCFVDEQMFGSLPFVDTEVVNHTDSVEFSPYCHGQEAGSSIYCGGMVGGHLIGL